MNSKKYETKGIQKEYHGVRENAKKQRRIGIRWNTKAYRGMHKDTREYSETQTTAKEYRAYKTV